MKVSLNWAQHHSNVALAPNGVDDLVTKIGAQLGAVEEVIEYGPQYEGALVVTIVSCEKHPNADKLNVCFIDDGGVAEDVERNGNGHVQVVCGAPNVRAGLTVVWLPPGATVPSTYHSDPFVLGARELRGIKSNGMLASASELAISDDHTGILEIDKEVEPGTSFGTMYGLNDVIIDIENKMFTHRPDCFGVLGVAREIAGIYQQEFKSPDWYLNAPSFTAADELPLTVKNELVELVPRFMAVAVKDVTIKPSPIWLQAGLTRVGIKPINNIVDITNYLAYITGQPLHAYDYDKVAARTDGDGAALAVRYPYENESIDLLNGKTIQPRSKAITIATDQELIGVGGVMGGSSTEVDNETKNIIIECATFDMYSIRRTSMAHGLFTDAVTRNNKGQSPLQNDRIIAKALELAVSQAGGVQASTVIDNKNEALAVYSEHNNFTQENTNEPAKVFTWGHMSAPITVEISFINERLGLRLNADTISHLLRNVEISAYKERPDQEEIEVIAPFWRTDIAIKEDIVEEVGRLYDFAKMPQQLPSRTTSPTPVNKALAMKQQVRTALASFGTNEVLTYSFVHGNLIQRAGQSTDYAFKLTNAISPELQYYRLSLTPSLLAQVHQNIKSGHNGFSLFEIGTTHVSDRTDDLPKESNMISMVTADKNRRDAAYYQVRAYLDNLAHRLGVTLTYKPITEPLDHQVIAPFELSRSALVSVTGSDIFLGIIGEYKQSVRKAFKLPEFCAGFEIGLDGLLEITSAKRYVPLSRFPSISQDICFEVDQTVSYADLTKQFVDTLPDPRDATQLCSYQPIDMYQADDSNKKRITYRITLTSYERTLTDSVLTKILDTSAAALKEALGAQRI